MDRAEFPDSRHLAAASYDPAQGTLEVTFRGGEQYRYEDVGRGVWNGLIAAKSAGAFFHREIRSRIPGQLL